MITAPWCTPDDLGGACTDLELDADVVDQAIAIASDVLCLQTGQRWRGVRAETVRPMASRTCSCWNDHGDPVQRNLERQRARCPRVRQQELGGYPVVAVQQVKIDGEVVDPARYRVDDRRYLTAVRASASDERLWWPSCQRMDLPDTEARTWSVTYTWGTPPPPAGVAAAASLACQLAIALSPDDDEGPGCRLPASWTTITRAGVSVTKESTSTLATLGLTGLPEVDLWINAVVQGQSKRGAAIIDPSRSRRVRRTGS